MAYGSVNVPGKPQNTLPNAITVPSGGVIIPPALPELAGGPWEFELTPEEEDVSQLKLSIDQILELRNVLSTFALRTQLSNLNLLDNWYFLDPINQRGQTEYTGNGYAIDRWGFARCTVSLTADGLKLTTNEGESSCVFYQKLERYRFIDGEKYTASFLVDDTIYTHTFVFSEAVNTSSDTINDISIQFVVEDAAHEKYDLILILNDDAVYPKAAKLELGTQQTLAHQDEDGNWGLNDPPPDKALGLAKCQRYFYGSLKGTLIYSSGGSSNEFWKLLAPFPVTMRCAPATQHNLEFGVNVLGTSSFNATITALELRFSENGGYYMRIQPGNLNPTKVYHLVIDNIDANL